MRISDWSSDVCSSDLPAIAAVAENRARGLELVEAHIAVHDVAADEPELAFEPFGRQARMGNDARAEDEIGRASCRERVCKCVKISVVAVYIQKKIHFPRYIDSFVFTYVDTTLT